MNEPRQTFCDAKVTSLALVIDFFPTLQTPHFPDRLFFEFMHKEVFSIRISQFSDLFERGAPMNDSFIWLTRAKRAYFRANSCQSSLPSPITFSLTRKK